MTLTQLEYFCTVCRYHSITRAAEVLYVSQPTISTSIRDLEKEFHLRLFHHGKNRILLTKDGEAFFQRAESILKQTQELYADFSDTSENRHPLRIGIPPMISTVFFPRVTDQFLERYSNISIQLLEYGSIRARVMLDNEQLDVAMANMDFYNLDKYNSHIMMEDRYVYCVARNHRYANEPVITMDMLRDEPIVLFNTDSVQTQTVITRLRSAGITPHVLMYCSQLMTVLNYVRGGSCGAFLYSSLAANPRDFVEIPVEPEITSKFGIIWKKGVFIPDQLTKFVDFIKTYDVTPYLPKR
jgi:DNA-binding transcriptional LysR family regulator